MKRNIKIYDKVRIIYRKREREGERERERDRQTDRQTERHTCRQTYTDVEGRGNRERY